MFEHQNIMRLRPLTSDPIETDVLNLYVKEGGVWGKLKRWWYDLFLLSYEDTRSKDFYMSSYAMMMARAAQFHNERNIIHPFSKFRNFWEFLILHAIIIRMILFNFNSSVVHSPHISIQYLLLVVDFILILDLYVTLKTGYAIKRTREVILNPHEILLNFLSTHAFFHGMAAIPYQSLMFLRLGKDIDDPSSRANLFICVLKLISLSQIVKLFIVSQYWAKERGTFTRTVLFKFMRIFVVGLVVSFEIIVATTATTVITGIYTGSIEPDSYNGYLLRLKYNNMVGNNGESVFLFIRLSRLFKNFFLFGFGVKPNTDIYDQVLAILSYWVAFVFHFWAGILLYSCVARDGSLNDRMFVARAQTFNILRVRGLPDEVHTKVVDYYDYKMSSLIILEKKNYLVKTLPPALRSEIKMNCYKDYVAKIPCFSKWEPEVIAKIVDLLQPEIYMENDLLSNAQNSYDGLMIVESGLLAVYSADQQERHVIDGDYFGESTLVADRETSSETVVAVTASTILLLDKILFRKMMAEFPNLFCSLRMEFLMASSTAVAQEETEVDRTGSTSEM